jgi:anti-anti-sigma factor
VADSMEFLVRRSGTTVVVALPEALVVANRNDLKRLVLELIHDNARPVIVIDLQRTQYIDSAGLGALVMLRKKATQRDGELWIANLNADLKQLFRLTNLESILPCLDEDDDDGAGRTAPRRPRSPGPLSASADADLPPPTDAA